MPPPALPGANMPGKSLHQRTKSSPALSELLRAGAVKANKKVLAEVNVNARILQAAKDDSELGKASPGKINLHEPLKPAVTATLARPAARPLAPKPASSQNVPLAVQGVVTKPTTTTQMSVTESEGLRKLVAKKSTKVLKDVPAPEPTPLESKPTTTSVPANHIPAPNVLPPRLSDEIAPVPMDVHRQEIHKTETVPLRDESQTRGQDKGAVMAVDPILSTYLIEQDYLQYVHHHTGQYQMQHKASGPNPYMLDPQPIPEQYFDVDEVDYEYDEGYTTARSFGLRGETTGGVTTILGPKYTDSVSEELRIAKEFVEATRTEEDFEDDAWDTSMVHEYGDDIFDYMRDLEGRMAPNARYMEQQTEIQWSMRAVLMDWVIQVHQRFNLLPETLFLTVNYIDRFLSCKIVSLGKLQLVGATAIFVAAKYEEVQCPTISEIIYMVDGGYTADELLKAERFMLSMLQFELGWPGPMSFLRRISKADDYDLETRTLAKYFLEVTIMDERFVGCTPSFLAAGAHCMARLMIYNGDWSKAHAYYSNYTWSQLRQLLAAMLECCEDPRKHHAAVYDKYTDKRYKRASTYVAGKLAAGFTVPIDNPPALPLPPMEYDGDMAGMLR